MLRHFVREGATAQINIDHSVRSDLEAALPPSLLELVEKMTADAKAKAAAGSSTAPSTPSAAAAAGGGDEDGALAASSKKVKVKTKKTTSAADDAVAPLNIAADIFDVAQSRVYELMERDLWARFRVDQASSAVSPRGKLKPKKPVAATPSTPNAATSSASTSSTSTATPNSSNNTVKQLSPRRKTNAPSPATVSSVSATLQAPAMVTQIKRVNGKIVVYRKGE